LKSKKALLFQRSSLKEGDVNSKFFYGCVKAILKVNSISALRVGENWLRSPNLIRDTVLSYFENHVPASPWERPKIEGVEFPGSPEKENVDHTSPFMESEIEVVKESDGNKSS
jgi:hypothetical protein